MVPTAEPTPADSSTRLIEGSLRVGRTVGSDWTELQEDGSRSCPRLLPWPHVQNILPPPLPVPAAPPPSQVTQSGSKSPANAPGEDPLPGAWSLEQGTGGSWRLGAEVLLVFLRGSYPPLGDCTKGRGAQKGQEGQQTPDSRLKRRRGSGPHPAPFPASRGRQLWAGGQLRVGREVAPSTPEAPCRAMCGWHPGSGLILA